jgi:hypothetical protein
MVDRKMKITSNPSSFNDINQLQLKIRQASDNIHRRDEAAAKEVQNIKLADVLNKEAQKNLGDFLLEPPKTPGL